MVCKVCGGMLRPGEKFCRYCGTPVPAQEEAPVVRQPAAPTAYPGSPQNIPQSPQNTPQAPQNTYIPGAAGESARTPVSRERRSGGAYSSGSRSTASAPKGSRKYAAPRKKGPGKKGLIIAGIAGAVVVAALAVVLLLTGTPSAKVAAAFAATGKEFTAVADTLELSAMGEFLQQDAMSQDLDVRLRSVDQSVTGMDSSLLSGIGIRLQLDANMEDRKLALQAAPYVGSADLLNLTVAMENDMVYFALPQFLPDDCYGFSTLTLMSDLENMGANVGEAAVVSFHFFEIAETIQTRVEEDQTAAAAELEAAGTRMVKALEVEKDGKRNVRVNGHSTKCTVYTVTVPQKELELWLEALEAYSDAVDYADIMEEALEMANLPADIVDELVREMESEIGSTDMSGLLELVEDLDGLTFQVCVSGGKVAAVLFEEELDGSDVELALYIGGKDAYMDEISLELSVDSMEYEIVWEGDHTAESGTFTDEMTCTYSYSGTVRSEFTLATELDTGSKADNLTMEFRMNGAAVILEGTWQADKDGLALEADSIRVEENNTTLLELSLDYSAGAYTDRVDTGSVRLLATIDSTGLEELLVAIEEKAATWAVDLFNKYPSLMNYI